MLSCHLSLAPEQRRGLSCNGNAQTTGAQLQRGPTSSLTFSVNHLISDALRVARDWLTLSVQRWTRCRCRPLENLPTVTEKADIWLRVVSGREGEGREGKGRRKERRNMKYGPSSGRRRDIYGGGAACTQHQCALSKMKISFQAQMQVLQDSNGPEIERKLWVFPLWSASSLTLLASQTFSNHGVSEM